jgi:tetratricopeptide (TPR) repeat protein
MALIVDWREPPVEEGGSRRRRTRGTLWGAALLAVASVWAASAGSAAEIGDGEGLLRAGKYDECAKMAASEIQKGAWDERWRTLKLTAELARGKDTAALATLEEGLRRFPASVSLRLLGRDVYRFNGRDEEAANALDTIERLVVSAPQRYGTPAGRVALGRFFLLRGADARKVLDQFYDIALKQQPEFVEAFLATAELALEKQDNALAASTLEKAPKEAAADPQFHYLVARAFSADDRARSTKALDEALKINPRHVDSLLLQADHLIDSEKYPEAAKALDRVLEVNPREPRAWAYRAVLAHLRSDPDGEASARRSALARWAKNPEVDHLIGRKLSQKYRFAEGAEYQVKALGFDPEYLPAKTQVCQDLLRLGEEAEGWKIAAEIFASDGYNVVAYNLVTLRDRLSGFRTLEGDGFVVRMDAREADLYGQRVLALLRRARKALCEKYGVTIDEPVIVEIFPQKKEFAVRTFGLPGADGLLGVCFGRVITANSPASQGEHPSNWEAVLWHEFCHVVTLSKTHNKMPRWLSEGISVYEEERQDPAWGSSMNPRFREMILGDALTPLSRLSSAFLGAESPLHLQFAYYESALAVEFFIERFGLPALKGALDDLGTGATVNEALPARTKMTLEQLDREFARFARARAERVAPGATWEEPDLAGDADSKAVLTWLGAHPKSFWGWQRLGARLVAEEKWAEAKDALATLKGLYPEYVGPENAYVLLANVHRRLSDPAAEHAVLDELVARDASASPAILRLLELDEAAGDWRGVAKNARRLLAVNPLTPTPHRQLARAAERLGEREEAVAAYRALALLDETDPAEVHYRLAKLLHQGGKPAEARREVLKALEDAPRFLDAHKLLLDLTGADPKPTARPPSPPPGPRPEGPKR